MQILNYRIDRRGIVNLVKEAEQDRKNDIIKRIFRTTPTRIAKQISDWQIATTAFESIKNPLNYLLQAVFRDIEVDAHLFALMQTIVLKVIANDFVLESEDGTADDEATKQFKKKWFRKIQVHSVNSKFYGFSAVQLGDIIDGCFSDAKLIPRDYVNQQLGGVQTSQMNTQELMYFTDEPWRWWVLAIGEPDDLGLLHKAAPLVIKKKEVISAWSEAAELFGMPLRIGKTNISSPKNRENMENMLENMGEAAWGVFDKDDEIEFMETAKTDFYKIYDSFIERANSELSKLILGQTGTTDEKSFTGASGVHESVMLDIIQSYIQFVEEVANEKVIPVLVYHGLLKPGLKYRALNEQKLSIKETIEALTIIAQHFKVDPEWITDKFDIPVEEKEEITAPVNVSGPPSAVMKEVKNLYKTYFEREKIG